MQKKRNGFSTIVLLTALLTVLLTGCGFQKDCGTGEKPELSLPCEVVRVVDGDTIVVRMADKKVKVRLIGVDTPESVHEDESRNTEEGKIASGWMKDLLEEETVYLELDAGLTDKYGRLLAYVYLDDGETMVNRLLLEEGYARTMTIQPNCKYADEFAELQTKAREDEKGFWATGFYR